jgi:hypothetical protein
MPCSPLKVNRRFRETYLHLQDRSISSAYYLLYAGFLLAYSATPKIEATCFPETSIDFQRATRCYMPEDRINHTTAVETSNHTLLG